MRLRILLSVTVFVVLAFGPLLGLALHVAEPTLARGADLERSERFSPSGLSTSSSLPVLKGSNVDVVTAPNDRQQVEPTVAVNPRNSSIVVAGAQDYRLRTTGGHRWHGYYRSLDGGKTWTNMLLPGFPGDTSQQGLSSPLRRFNTTSDPVMAWDRAGNLYYTGIAFNVTASGICCLTAFVAKYINDGANYFGATLIAGVTSADKPWIAVDATGGPFDGNVYLIFDAVLGGLFTSVFTRSTDGGNTFSTPIRVPAGTGGIYGTLPGITVDPSGTVYVSTLPYDPIRDIVFNYIQVSKLTNGGGTLAGTFTAANPVNLLPNNLPGGSFRTFTIPQMAADSNGIYLVWDDFTGGNSNVRFTRSVNAGLNWSPPITVNDVTLREQFFPTITTTAGIVGVAWYDSRFSSTGLLDKLDVYYAQLALGGSSFSPSLRLTSQSFDPNIVKRTDAPNYNEPFMGDYIHISPGPATVQVIWADNRNACNTVDPVYGCIDQDVFVQEVAVAVRDVAILNMAPSRLFAYSGVMALPVQVNVTIHNLGTVAEAFTVKAVANTTVIGAKSITLAPTSSTNATFSWDTQALALGSYELSAQISPVPGETSLSDNSFNDGTFTVRFNGDLNGDCKVDIVDIASVALAFDSTPNSSRWNSNADIDNDGVVTIIDVATAALNFDTTCP